eukprot:4090742-Pyramimonas_sp.AAC.1
MLESVRIWSLLEAHRERAPVHRLRRGPKGKLSTISRETLGTDQARHLWQHGLVAHHELDCPVRLQG